jgi:hypothetical protein
MISNGFKPAIQATECLQTYALESTANGIGAHYRLKNMISTISSEKSWESTLCCTSEIAIIVKQRLVISIFNPQYAVSVIVYLLLTYSTNSQLLQYLEAVCSISRY